MTKQERLLNNYANTAADLAESVKRNIQHGGIVDDTTILALNDFIIAANEVSDLLETLNQKNQTLN